MFLLSFDRNVAQKVNILAIFFKCCLETNLDRPPLFITKKLEFITKNFTGFLRFQSIVQFSKISKKPITFYTIFSHISQNFGPECLKIERKIVFTIASLTMGQNYDFFIYYFI
jgi:hypothetical protein